jgi:GNAT superfamily N-acetyltransferase
MQPPYRIAPLDQYLDGRAAFSCGVEPLDTYIKNRARKEHEARVTFVYVLPTGEGQDIAGFYTISSATINFVDLPPEKTKRLPRYPALPAILIGRLAVDERYRGRGLGEYLLMDALKRSLRISKEIGAMAVIVDAKDENAISFYRKYKFTSSIDRENFLYITMRTIEQAFSE